MKFESLLQPQTGISYVSLLSVLVLAAFLYIFAANISERPSNTDEETKQKIEHQKELSKQTAILKEQNPIEQKPVVQELQQDQKAALPDQTKNEVRKTNGRELGFDLDFGSYPPRLITNFVLPEAKNAGSGRVILKFRFSIRPDGSVAKVFPIMKGEPELELEAMNLLRKWRFEKLSRTEDQIDQKVEISFRPQ